MCGHWLCGTGNNGVCYFVPDPNKLPIGTTRDMSELEWDLLDELHDAVVANPASPRAAGILGVQIESCARRVTHADAELGKKCREAMEARYAHDPAANPRLMRKVVVLRTDGPETAAQKLRLLGEDFVAGLVSVLSTGAKK